MSTAELLGIPDGTPVFPRTWVIVSPSEEVQVVSEVITTANSSVRVMETEVPANSETQAVSYVFISNKKPVFHHTTVPLFHK